MRDLEYTRRQLSRRGLSDAQIENLFDRLVDGTLTIDEIDREVAVLKFGPAALKASARAPSARSMPHTGEPAPKPKRGTGRVTQVPAPSPLPDRKPSQSVEPRRAPPAAPARSPAPSPSPDRKPSKSVKASKTTKASGLEGRWYKLKAGGWGVKINDLSAQPGDTVTITRADGAETRTAVIGMILFTAPEDGVLIATVRAVSRD